MKMESFVEAEHQLGAFSLGYVVRFSSVTKKALSLFFFCQDHVKTFKKTSLFILGDLTKRALRFYYCSLVF